MHLKRTCTRGTHQRRQCPRFNIAANVVKEPQRPTGHRNMIVEILPRKCPPVSFGADPTTGGLVHNATAPRHHGDALVPSMRLPLRLLVIKLPVAFGLLLTLNFVERFRFFIFLGINTE